MLQSPTAPANSPSAVDLSRVAQDLQIRKVQVENVVQLLDEGNTVPFITRYRKERTGGLNEEVIRRIQDRVKAMRALAERKQTILKSIEGQGKLTEDLRAAILAAETPKRLEDLYLPFKPKKRTLASDARDRGLEPLALAIWNRDPTANDLAALLPTMVNPDKGLNTAEEVLQGARYILAEMVAETADVRGAVRHVIWDSGKITSTKHEKLAEGHGQEYRDYFQFTEAARSIPPHRILALNRGEKENALVVKLEWDAEAVKRAALDKLPLADHPHRELLSGIVDEALERLILPSLEREIRRELTDEAQDHAVSIFARNLRSLLLQPPLRGKRLLAIDPGLRTGCKLAVLDETGNLLAESVIYPHPPQKREGEAKAKLEELIRRHQLTVIAIGNGTACRETEKVVSDLIAEFEAHRREGRPFAPFPIAPPPPPKPTPKPPTPLPTAASEVPASPPEVTPTEAPAVEATPPAESAAVTPPEPVAAEAPPPEPLPEPPAELAYVIVNEAGASDYSASPIAREEFPDLDATLRGTISIGRRLQDPLSELVKIDPQHVGVGLYQHDVKSKNLKESLEAVIESCVNHVGVDVNTASVPLLRHVSGLNALVARDLVEYRKQHGPFRSRAQLLQVPNLGEKRYEQAAGFLKVIGGDDPLDTTWVHPESYPATRQLLGELGYDAAALLDKNRLGELQEKLKTLTPEEVAARLQIGGPTLRDIIDSLAKPGRDPRDDLPPPIFRKGILKLEDLQPGMELKGTVLNVVPFGAFVDIGLKDSGLVHISQMANRYIKHPFEVVAVGDVVTVWVLTIDPDRRRASLTMIEPGTKRVPPPRGGGGPRPPQGQGYTPPRPEGQPVHGDRPPAARQGGGGPPRQGGGGPPRQAGGRPPFRSGPPRQGGGGPPRRQGPPVEAAEAAPPPPPPPPPPRQLPPRKPKPLPTLTQAKKEGKAALHTFGELEAFFKAKTTTDEPGTPPPPATEPSAPSANDPEPPAPETPPQG